MTVLPIKNITLFFLLLLGPMVVFGQEDQLDSNQHRFYVYWGWNRGYFTKSDIHFENDLYDFTLKDVVAKDRQTPFAFDVYFHPAKLTIPQTNFGIGYYFKDRFILTLSVDHMKYVVQQNQEVTINGFIKNTHPNYDGEYTGQAIQIEADFLRMEHTDGLNYISFGISRARDLLAKAPSLRDKLELQVIRGLGIGFVMPRTDVTVLNQETRNKYHLSGWGGSAELGLRLTFFKHYFIHGVLKGGYINLSDIRTGPDENSKASQDFYFLQKTIQFGGVFYLKKSKAKKSY